MNTDEVWRQYQIEYQRNAYRRDRENEGRMTAAEFARIHKINPWALRRRMSGGMSWTPPRYTIEFTADELVSMGAPDTENLISDEIDVTKFVRSGELTVT